MIENQKLKLKFRYRLKDKSELSDKWFFVFITIEQLESGFFANNYPSKQFSILSKDRFIGVKTKQNKEIYEGDILKDEKNKRICRDDILDKENERIFAVYWCSDSLSFLIQPWDENPLLVYHFEKYLNSLKIIGNIYESKFAKIIKEIYKWPCGEWKNITEKQLKYMNHKLLK